MGTEPAPAPATSGLVADAAAMITGRQEGEGVLGLYDLIFGLIAYAVFDFLLED